MHAENKGVSLGMFNISDKLSETARGFAFSSLAAIVIAAGVGPAQTPPEPGLLEGVSLVNISRNSPKFASVFPQVAVSRSNPKLVAAARRQYNLPVDTNALEKDRVAECHVSISKDGGKTFTDRNMMDVM